MAEVGETVDVAKRTCGIHVEREAVAQCPSCRKFFCRECITEHDYQMICAGCLAALLEGKGDDETAQKRAGISGPVLTVVQVVSGVMLVWFVCFTIAELLRQLPPDLHSGSMFEDIMMEAQRAALAE